MIEERIRKVKRDCAIPTAAGFSTNSTLQFPRTFPSFFNALQDMLLDLQEKEAGWTYLISSHQCSPVNDKHKLKGQLCQSFTRSHWVQCWTNVGYSLLWAGCKLQACFLELQTDVKQKLGEEVGRVIGVLQWVFHVTMLVPQTWSSNEPHLKSLPSSGTRPAKGDRSPQGEPALPPPAPPHLH